MSIPGILDIAPGAPRSSARAVPTGSGDAAFADVVRQEGGATQRGAGASRRGPAASHDDAHAERASVRGDVSSVAETTSRAGRPAISGADAADASGVVDATGAVGSADDPALAPSIPTVPGDSAPADGDVPSGDTTLPHDGVGADVEVAAVADPGQAAPTHAASLLDTTSGAETPLAASAVVATGGPRGSAQASTADLHEARIGSAAPAASGPASAAQSTAPSTPTGTPSPGVGNAAEGQRPPPPTAGAHAHVPRPSVPSAAPVSTPAPASAALSAPVTAPATALASADGIRATGADGTPDTAPGAPAAAAPAEARPVAASAPSAAVPAPRPALLPQVSAPVLALARAADGAHSVTLTVAPESLGPVTVRAHIAAGVIRLELHAPSEAGREALRAILTDLRRDLAVAAPGSSLALSSDSASSGQPSDARQSSGGRADSGADTGPGSSAREERAPRPGGHRASPPAIIPPRSPHGGIDLYA